VAFSTIVDGGAHDVLTAIVGVGLVKASLILALCGAGLLALRRGSAAARHTLLALALGLLVALPLAALLGPPLRLLPAERAPAAVRAATVPASAPRSIDTPTQSTLASDGAAHAHERGATSAPRPSPGPAGPASRPGGRSTPIAAGPGPWTSPAFADPPLGAWALAVWLSGALVLAIRFALGRLRLRRLSRGARPLASADRRASALAGDLGIGRAVQVWVSDAVAVPITWGVRRPRIALPAEAARWPAARLHAVLAHELAHVRRLDALTQALAQLVRALYWFNPLVWVACRLLRAERERACDDRVLELGMPPGDYAAELVAVARGALARGALAEAALGMARRSQLERRIRAILDGRRRRRPRRRLAAALVVGASLLVAPLGALASRQPAALAAQPQVGRAAAAHGGTDRAASARTAAAPSHDRFVDLDWLTPQRGWALVQGACGRASGRCLAVYGTRDGGRSWQRLTPPDAFGCSAASTCLSGIRFVTDRVGYLSGPRSYATADGGRTWTASPGPPVESIAVAGGRIYELVYAHTGCPGPCQPALVVRSPQDPTARTVRRWRTSPGFGEQVVAGGANLYVIFYGHVAGGGASAHARIAISRDGGRTWSGRGDPCGGSALHEKDATAIAAAGRFVAVLCVPRTGRGPVFAALSGDAGRTFRPVAALALGAPEQIAVSEGGAIAVGNGGITGGGRFEYELALSGDAGRSWRVAIRDREPVAAELPRSALQFISARTVSWVGSPFAAWLSSDAGRTWRKSPAP